MRHRNMFYATGLPGWMRFGYSPGWVGRSASGLGPCAQFLMSGQWPTPQTGAAWQAMQAGGPMPMWGPGPVAPDPQTQLQFLRSQATMIEQQLEALRQQIAAIEEAE